FMEFFPLCALPAGPLMTGPRRDYISGASPRAVDGVRFSWRSLPAETAAGSTHIGVWVSALVGDAHINVILCRAWAARFLDTNNGAPLTLSHSQNVSRTPICPVLVDATLVILPKLGCVTVRTGSLYCSQLNALNASAR